MVNLHGIKKMFRVGRNTEAQATRVVIRNLTASQMWAAHEAGYTFPNCRVIADDIEYAGMEKDDSTRFVFWRAGGDEYAHRVFSPSDVFTVIQLQKVGV